MRLKRFARHSVAAHERVENPRKQRNDVAGKLQIIIGCKSHTKFGICDGLRPIFSSFEAPVITFLQTLLHSGDGEAPCNSFMRWRNGVRAKCQSHMRATTRNQHIGAGAKKSSRQRSPSLYISKRPSHPWAGGRVLRSGVTHGKAQGLRSICEV
jgi:hypothetical protein